MTHVFLSYSRNDLPHAERVAARLLQEGLTCWWDQTLVAGERWAEVTRAELRQAGVVAVLWSETSWASRWVQAEAYAGYERGKLICARIDDIALEPPFNIVQTADLRTDAGLRQLVDGAKRILWEKSAEGSVRAATRPPQHAVRRASPRIAVLPFENLSPNPENAFFADGIHEQVLSTLASKARSLEVISRTTMMSLRGRAVSIAKIAEELRCSHVLEGTVRRESGNVRVTVQLIDAAQDLHVWSEDYDRTLSNALTLQTEIAAEVAAQLSVRLTTAPGSRRDAPHDPRAYDYYLKARIARQNMGGNADPLKAWREVDDLLGKAIECDQKFALAYVERAVGNWYLYVSNFNTMEEALQLVRDDIGVLEKLAPADPSVIAVKGLLAITEQNYDEALRRLTEAEGLGLVDPDLLQWKGVLLTRLDRREEAEQLFNRLVSLDPGNLFLLMFVFTAAVFALRPLEAARIADLGLVRSPGNIVWIAMKANLRALFCGDATERSAIVEMIYSNLVALQFDAEGFIAFYVEHLIFARRYEEALSAMDAAKLNSFIMIWYASLPVMGLGRFPLAVARGKVNLLLGRTDDAFRDGEIVLDYASRQTPAKMNIWAHEALRAFGLMLKGDSAANETARKSVAMALALPDAVHWAAARHLAAQIFAFTGAVDEAIDMLEIVALRGPGVAPLYVVGDPAFADRLSGNPRYEALSAHLRTEMHSLKVE